MDSKDKAWQINRMCGVYRLSQLCIVFPGGLQRLVGLDEETPWITRMWTLQEAVTPAKCVVLYSAAADHTSQAPRDSDATFLQVPSHGKPLISVTSVYYSPLTDLLPRTMSKKTGEIRLFGHVSNGYTLLLRDALDCQGQDATTYEQRYQRYLAMWRSAVSRSSDRPQDLLLSTMGLFDISLGVGQQRSSESIMTAFVNEFRKQGILDVRVIAFRDAVRRAEAFITAQWRTLIEEFDHSFPLLENGITPTSDYELPLSHAGPPVLHDSLGREVFLGSTLLITGAEHSLHPSRIVASSSTSFSCIMTYGGKEIVHNGRWELKPFDSEKMEWISTSHGRSPEGRVPVDGGYEKDVQYMRQRSLYYALASVKNQQGIEEQFIGKTGIHLGGCCFGKDGKENFIRENYMILCWKIGKKNTEFTMSSDAKQDDVLFWSRPNLPLVSGLPVITADR
ncbi:hypothetical protein QCA50_016171 [Cerrena zonata]|uniref:Heterokaryon incompatibility domain-containing protein n=1 Tax=Cerrena zonata TaxID=2478898 RepID=A0AAW0FJD0_9APHY